MNDKKNIKYLNRDFDAILKKLVDYTQYYYPNSLNDFSPASPAMVILQLIAYVGDVLNFYIDKQTKQSILYYAQQKQSIYNIAQSYGYKIKKSIPSTVQLIFRIPVPVNATGGPDYRFAPILLPGTVVFSSNNSNNYFRIIDQVNFKECVGDDILPVYVKENEDQYKILQKKVIGYSLTQQQSILSPSTEISSYLKLYLPDQKIVKIIDVVDEYGNKWYQVSNLSDDNVIDYDTQYEQGVKVFKRKKTNKRFKVLMDVEDKQYMYFGAKQTSNILNNNLYQKFYQFDTNQLATPASMILNNNYGQVPTGDLTINYLVDNGAKVQSGQVDSLLTVNYHNYETIGMAHGQLIKYEELQKQLIVLNQKPSVGGGQIQSLQTIKQNAIGLINSQNRLVTRQDYQKAMSIMPAQFGSIYRSHVDINNSNNVVQIFVIGIDSDGQLTNIPDNIKENIGNYLQKYRIVGTLFEIKDAYIINVECKFTINVNKQYSKQQILYKAIRAVQDYMSIENFKIGSYIDVNEIRNLILSIQGVSNIVGQIEFNNMTDDGYSNVSYNMDRAFKDGKYYTDRNPSIFELKYPDIDISGRVL